jgi:hypothetical protein
VRVDTEAVGRLLAWLKANGRTERYRVNTKQYLAQWARALGGCALRRVTLQDLRRVLAGWETARKGRIIAIKTFLSYLRDVGRYRGAASTSSPGTSAR